MKKKMDEKQVDPVNQESSFIAQVVAASEPYPIGLDCPYSCMVYRVGNLGDMIQTVALSQLLPQSNGIFRHAMRRAPRNQLLIVNGFLERDPAGSQVQRALFSGVSGPYWRRKEYLEWFRLSPWPIGARDPHSFEGFKEAGLRSELVGCATMTFPRYNGRRSGILSVDFPGGPGTALTHRISRRMTVKEQWNRALCLLDRYRTAEAVYTSRLHVALPCLAMGTPVCIASPKNAPLPERFSILEEIGVPYGRLCEFDLSQWAERYCRFLSAQLEIPIEIGAPKPPVLVERDRLDFAQACSMLWADTKSRLSGLLAVCRRKE